ncbi:flagellar basal body P-ring protein FlgI [Caminibacter mediatlanticus TB-2]|uniref:Flagellar P-ring protein n=1 Tax=Caminibacter mediatlanticus TB-2 TaxID=391592 RepID=A0ABX5V7B4_9BACT|nr:flagellar basal body P-ring protein FlgI [Caminibacter mediatlanticus]QCT94118.1 flagellar basal body P-ring protein FlgI [Caminibacter mediatlanticus TB-2]
MQKVLILIIFSTFLFSQTIKDISNIVGVRSNQLIGYGLVVGLKGSGDSSSKFTNQTLSNLLKNVNVKLDPKDIKSKNVAAVMVTATLPPFAREGDKLDVTVSSIGDAKSLEGGVLLITPLKGVNGKIYALAQGPITIGGFNLKGGKKQKHFTTTVKVINGATVERSVVWDIYHQNFATLSLKKSDFNLAIKVQNIINKYYKQQVAIAIDPRTVKLKKPANLSMPEFLAKIQTLPISIPKENIVVIDERTGTVVAGSNITIDPVVIMYGNFTIRIDKKTSVLELTQNLQKVKATPQDVIAILENLRASNALNAKIIIN